MRLVLVLVVACSSPPVSQAPPHPAPPPPADADGAVAVTDTAPSKPRRILSAFVYDWEVERAKLETSRRSPRHDDCSRQTSPQSTACTPANVTVAARGTMNDAIDFTLDVGSDDGVSDRDRAALLDDHGVPVSTFMPVDRVAPRRCHVRLAERVADPITFRFVVMSNPPTR